MNKNIACMLAAYFALNSIALAADSHEIKINLRYQNSTTQKLESKTIPFTLPNLESEKTTTTDEGILKTLFVTELGNTVEKYLQNFEAACNKSRRPVPPIVRPHLIAREELKRCGPIRPYTTMPPPPPRCIPTLPPAPVEERHCWAARTDVAENFETELKFLQSKMSQNPALLGDIALGEFMDLMADLTENMKNQKILPRPSPRPGPIPRPAPRHGVQPPSAAPHIPGGGTSVTTGGAKDIHYFKKLIQNGSVPEADVFSMEGFLSQFNFPLQNALACHELLCLTPAAAFQPKEQRLSIQLELGSGLDLQTFQRKALNLALVLDVSGSMNAEDGTEKSRLEWAKETLIDTLQQLKEGDLVSIVIFDDQPQILFDGESISSKEKMIQTVQELKTGGSTNLEAGLRNGFELTSKHLKEEYENRVILISDAGLNMGVTDETTLLKLVTDYGSETIGLTAIGLGDSFNQKLIETISMSKGGNYIFVQTGKDMQAYFKNFDLLVSPIAYHLKASLDLNGLNAKLSKTYGIPMPQETKKKSVSLEFINIQTLFLAGPDSGGTLLLEYTLKK